MPIRVCESCKEEIDDDICWCGGFVGDHLMDEHLPVPIGCSCHFMYTYLTEQKKDNDNAVQR